MLLFRSLKFMHLISYRVIDIMGWVSSLTAWIKSNSMNVFKLFHILQLSQRWGLWESASGNERGHHWFEACIFISSNKTSVTFVCTGRKHPLLEGLVCWRGRGVTQGESCHTCLVLIAEKHNTTQWWWDANSFNQEETNCHHSHFEDIILGFRMMHTKQKCNHWLLVAWRA